MVDSLLTQIAVRKTPRAEYRRGLRLYGQSVRAERTTVNNQRNFGNWAEPGGKIVFVPCGTLAQVALTDNDVIVRDSSVAKHNVADHMARCSYGLTPGGHSPYGKSNDEERK